MVFLLIVFACYYESIRCSVVHGSIEKSFAYARSHFDGQGHEPLRLKKPEKPSEDEFHSHTVTVALGRSPVKGLTLNMKRTVIFGNFWYTPGDGEPSLGARAPS